MYRHAAAAARRDGKDISFQVINQEEIIVNSIVEKLCSRVIPVDVADCRRIGLIMVLSN